MTVEPVVVRPDMVSKKASVTLIRRLEKQNGSDPNVPMPSHDERVST